MIFPVTGLYNSAFLKRYYSYGPDNCWPLLNRTIGTQTKALAVKAGACFFERKVILILKLLILLAAALLLPDETDDTVPQETEKDKQIRPGDVIFVERAGNLYRHYGVYVGDGEVIHYSSEDGDFGENISIHKTVMERFLDGAGKYYICRFPKQSRIKGYHLYTKRETVERAYQRLGERRYDLLNNNCEHFAVWCQTNISNSSQVKMLENGLLSLIQDV